MKRYVAIYMPDVRYKEMPVFQYNENNKRFEYENKDDLPFSYPVEVILTDKDWMIFWVNGEEFDDVEKYTFNYTLGKVVEDYEINEY